MSAKDRTVEAEVDYTSETGENGKVFYYCLICNDRDIRMAWGEIQNHVIEEHFPKVPAVSESDHTDHVNSANELLEGASWAIDRWRKGTMAIGDAPLLVATAQVHATLALTQQLRAQNLIELRKEFIAEDDYRRASALLNLEIRPLLGLNP